MVASDLEFQFSVPSVSYFHLFIFVRHQWTMTANWWMQKPFAVLPASIVDLGKPENHFIVRPNIFLLWDQSVFLRRVTNHRRMFNVILRSNLISK